MKGKGALDTVTNTSQVVDEDKFVPLLISFLKSHPNATEDDVVSHVHNVLQIPKSDIEIYIKTARQLIQVQAMIDNPPDFDANTRLRLEQEIALRTSLKSEGVIQKLKPELRESLSLEPWLLERLFYCIEIDCFGAVKFFIEEPHVDVNGIFKGKTPLD